MKNLRPLEKVILRLDNDDVSVVDIARRVGKKPGTVSRILQMVQWKDDEPATAQTGGSRLRPLERVILRLRNEGETYGEIGNRLNRSGAQVRRIEEYTKLKA